MSFKKLVTGLLIVGIFAGVGMLGIGQAQSETQTAIAVQLATPYTPDQNLADDYRCFLLNPDLSEDAYVTGYQIYPGQERLVHHVILFVAGPGVVSQAEATDRSVAGPGWTCFGDTGVPGVSGVSGNLGIWAPGTTNTIFPEGTAKLVRAGSQIIMQIHYNVRGNEVGPDATSAEIFVSSESSLKLMSSQQAISAVEIRCPGPYPTEQGNRCNRSYALSQVKDPGVNASLHSLCGSNVGYYLSRDVGAGDAQDVSCSTIIRREGLALGALGHMHLRGKSLKVEINPDSEAAVVVLDIENWNFNRQEQYWFDEAIPLHVGDVLKITCVYDNSRAIPGPDGMPLEPRYIIWGEGTTDEMCLALVNWIEP